MADGIRAVIHVDVQGIVGGPAGPDSAHFEAQIVQGLVGHAQGQGIGQLHGTVGICILKLFHPAPLQSPLILGLTIDIGRDLGLVGQADGPLIVQAGMQAEVAAHAPAGALDFNIIVKSRIACHDRQRCRKLLLRGQVDVHDLQTGGHGEYVIDLPGQGGHGGDGLQVDAVQIVAAGPVLVIAVAQTEAREHAQAQPQAVVELPAGIRMRHGPHSGLGGGLLLAVRRIQREGPHGSDKAHTAHDLDAGQLGDAGRVIGDGRHIVGTAHHAAGQTQTACAPLGQCKTFSHGGRRHSQDQGHPQGHHAQSFHSSSLDREAPDKRLPPGTDSCSAVPGYEAYRPLRHQGRSKAAKMPGQAPQGFPQ